MRFARVGLPNPVDPARAHGGKQGIRLRADTITDLLYAGGALFVAGLSNEEFAATLWRVEYAFEGPIATTTLESYHGAHGKLETDAPIRSFVTYPLKGSMHVLAAYLCTSRARQARCSSSTTTDPATCWCCSGSAAAAST